jgi:hypothetical protein
MATDHALNPPSACPPQKSTDDDKRVLVIALSEAFSLDIMDL